MAAQCMSRTPGRHLVPALALLLFALAAATGLVDPRLEAAEPATRRWRFAGLAGKDVQTIAVDPFESRRIYATAPFGDLHRSTDGGATWSLLYDFAYREPPTFALDPVDPQKMYAGNVATAYKSGNGGIDWVTLDLGEIRAFAVDPRNNQQIYAGGWYPDGLTGSSNGGASWSTLLAWYEVRAVAVSPDDGTVYALGRDDTGGSPVRGGIMRSLDAGLTWTRVLTASNLNVLALHSQQTNTLYVGTEGAGVLKSEDGGASWKTINVGLNHTVVRAITVAPQDGQILYAGTWEGGVYQSRDGGVSWSQLNEGLGNLYVLDLVVDPTDPFVLYAGTRGGGVFKYSGPPPPPPGALYAHIVDEAGEPLGGAWVARNGVILRDASQQPLVTDAAGNLVLAGAAPGDTLVALKPQLERSTVRGGHDGWAYRIFTTSISLDARGQVGAAVVEGTRGPQKLTVRAASPLVLFNLVVSVEWDADQAYLDQVRAGMTAASDYLYDFTDGQMAFGKVTVFDKASAWSDADIQIATANIVRPHAFVGGITASDRARVIRLGRGWDGASGAQGAWSEPDGYRTIAHEFGHYGLYLFDEYFGFASDGAGGYNGEVRTECTSGALRAAVGFGRAASVMDDQYRSSELSIRDLTPLWSAGCTNTAQWQLNGESAWETLARRYGDAERPARWQITTPAIRGGVLDGPGELPATVLAVPELPPTSNDTAPPSRTLVVVDQRGQPVRGAIVALQKPDGRMIGQGLTDNAGSLELYGADPGDVVRVVSIDGGLHGKLAVTDVEQLRLVLEEVPSLAASPATRPHITISPQSTASGSVDLVITLHEYGAAADPNLLVVAPGGITGSAPLLSFSPTTATYEARVSIAATERGTGHVRADRKVGGERPLLQAPYRLQRVRNDVSQEVFSDDGHLHLHLPPGSLADVESYVVVMPTGAAPGAPPAGLTQVGEAYVITASGATGVFEKRALLALSYDEALVNGPPPGLAIYRWNPNLLVWEQVGGEVEVEHLAVTAPIRALGIYALMAPAGQWSAPLHTVSLPLLRR